MSSKQVTLVTPILSVDSCVVAQYGKRRSHRFSPVILRIVFVGKVIFYTFFFYVMFLCSSPTFLDDVGTCLHLLPYQKRGQLLATFLVAL